MWKFIFIIVLCFSVHNCNYIREHRSAHSRTANSFAFDVYQKAIEGQNGNVVISPFSIYSALTMALLGATRGSQTQKEMLTGLKFPRSSWRTVLITHGSLTRNLYQNDNLKIANKIYIKQGFTIKPSFQNLIRGFKSKAENIDFTQSNKASSTINKWVEDQTNNKINNLISPDLLNDDIMMILVNTVYYKGIWKYKFDERKPLNLIFFTSETEHVNVDSLEMFNDLYFGEFDNLNMKALRLPYTDPEISMLMLLPNKRMGLAELENKLRRMNISDIWDEMEETEVKVRIPKFKIEFEVDLNEPLKKMGMKKMFTSEAEFSHMIEGSENLSISDVRHKAVIEVNEEGTEASSATDVMGHMICGGCIEEFEADHPFLFFLVANDSKQILFMGRVVRF